MRVILLENVDKLGKAGDVVKVADGFARNYLMPNRFAITASANNLKRLEIIKEEAEKKIQENIDKLKMVAENLKNVELQFNRRADENGHLFGSVSHVDIIKALIEKEPNVNKSMLKEEVHFKTIGEYEIEIVLAHDIRTSIKVIVSREE